MTGDDRCILYCRVFQSNLYYPLKEKVIDGTPCAPESFDICVNGQCKSAGCDHILSSDVRLGKLNINPFPEPIKEKIDFYFKKKI